MSISRDGALRLCPFQNGKVPTRPVFQFGGAWIDLFLQLQQHEMAAVAGGKSRNFDVIAQRRLDSGFFAIFGTLCLTAHLFKMVNMTGKELALVSETRSPGKNGADVKRLAFCLTQHHFRGYALGGTFVMGTTRCMDMAVSRVISEAAGLYPALECQIQIIKCRAPHFNREGLAQVLGAASKVDRI